MTFADARAVEETAAQLDIKMLEQVVDAVVAAERVDVYGVGASAFVAADFQQKLHRIGRVCSAWADAHIMLTSAAVLGNGDVAIGISHTGATVETIDALEVAKTRGAKTVALTNFPKSPIAEVADLILTTAARETTFRSGATASRAGAAHSGRLRLRRSGAAHLRADPQGPGSHVRGGPRTDRATRPEASVIDCELPTEGRNPGPSTSTRCRPWRCYA